jgi:hypothetical protein
MPPEFAAKATRHGWAPDVELLPRQFVGGPDGPADVERRGAHHLYLMIATVFARDRQHADAGDGGPRHHRSGDSWR